MHGYLNKIIIAAYERGLNGLSDPRSSHPRAGDFNSAFGSIDCVSKE